MLLTDGIDDRTALGFSIGPILLGKAQKRSSAGWTFFVLSRVLVSSLSLRGLRPSTLLVLRPSLRVDRCR